MKVSPGLIGQQETVVAIPNHQGAFVLMQNDPGLPRDRRHREFPMEELISLLTAEKQFRVDLSLRVQVAGQATEIQLPVSSGHEASPSSSVDDLFTKVTKALSVSLVEGLRRSTCENDNANAEAVRFGDVDVDFRRMELRRCGIRVPATAHEFKVLKYFFSRPEEVISREELLNQVWGYENYPTTRTVDNRILKLRQKLELKPSEPVHFLTVYGVGYKFVP